MHEGDLYKKISIGGRDFEIRYGFYADYERESGLNDPIPIYPDFKAHPMYTADGFPFVTQMQGVCEHGDSRFLDGFCIDCRYFVGGDDLIGICKCKKRRLNKDS